MKCCNNNCSQGDECPLRHESTGLLVQFLEAVLLTACAVLLSAILVEVLV